MRRDKISLLLWLFICAIALGLFQPTYFLKGKDYPHNPSPAASLTKNWFVYYGDHPASGTVWKSFDQAEWSKLNSYKGTLWVKRVLPEIPWRNPYLFLGGMNRFEVYLDGKSVYRFPTEPGQVWNHYLMTRHPLRISPEDQGKVLSFRIEWDRLPFSPGSLILGGEPDQVLSLLLRFDSARYIYSTLYLIAGLVGIVLFVRRREKLYLWFTLLTLSAGFGLLLLCGSLQWFLNVRAMYYWKDLLLPFGVYAFAGLYGEVLSASKRLPILITKITLLSFTIATLCVGIWSPTYYWKMFTVVFPLLAVVAMGVVIYAIFRYPRSSQRYNERKWLLRGFAILVICGLAHIIGNVSAVSEKLLSTRYYIINIIGNILPNGLLLFMICMVMVIINRIGHVYQESERNAKDLQLKNNELEQFHRNLEQLVDIRTKELEEANRSLTVTLREKAETLAEVSVLEERNRIAHEMHDVVGHTLTAAIVQLEAGKKLAAKEGHLPLDKLDIVSGLVRKGLDDIRKAVRMLKSDSPPVKLETALRELIRDTIDTMEVAIEARIEIPGELELGKLTEQVIYHALQEGLTNGIRHARCSRFRYSLNPADDDKLEIRLWNDGKPFGYAKPGFGLTTMMERIHLLGGTVTIGSSEGEDGIPLGCELAITLPIPRNESSQAS